MLGVDIDAKLISRAKALLRSQLVHVAPAPATSTSGTGSTGGTDGTEGTDGTGDAVAARTGGSVTSAAAPTGGGATSDAASTSAVAPTPLTNADFRALLLSAAAR